MLVTGGWRVTFVVYRLNSIVDLPMFSEKIKFALASFRHLLIIGSILAGICGRAPVGAAEPGGAEIDGPMPRSASTVGHFMVQLSGGMINAILTQPKEEVEPVRDVILDARIFGTAWTRACLKAELIPDPAHASVDLVVRGTTRTHSVGLPPELVKLYTVGDIHFMVRKRIGLNAQGIMAVVPCVKLNSYTKLLKVTNYQNETDFPGAEVAEKVFEQSREEATSIVEAKARRKLKDRMETEIIPKLCEAQKIYSTALDWVQQKLGRRLDKVHFFSTASSVHLAVQLQTSTRSGTIQPPPPLPETTDLGVSLSESLVNDLGQSVLAGKTFTLDELSNLEETIQELLPGKDKGKTNGKPKSDKGVSKQSRNGSKSTFFPVGTDLSRRELNGAQPAPEDSIAITFARKEPIAVTFADQSIKVALFFDNYKMGGENYQGFRGIASFKIEKEGNQVTVIPQGKLEIQPVEDPASPKKKLPKTEQVFLRQAFENVSTIRLTLPEINLPEPFTRIGVLLPLLVEAQNGWLRVAWERKIDCMTRR